MEIPRDENSLLLYLNERPWVGVTHSVPARSGQRLYLGVNECRNMVFWCDDRTYFVLPLSPDQYPTGAVVTWQWWDSGCRLTMSLNRMAWPQLLLYNDLEVPDLTVEFLYLNRGRPAMPPNPPRGMTLYRAVIADGIPALENLQYPGHYLL